MVRVYSRRIEFEWNHGLQKVAAKKRERRFDLWIEHLTANPPDVFIGTTFNSYGGVRHHIKAIKRHSSMNVKLAPSEELKRNLNAHYFTHWFREKCSRFPATEIKVTHPHVISNFPSWQREHVKSD